MTETPLKERVSRMTVDSFLQLYDEMGGIEWIDGEIIKLSPMVYLHGWITRQLFLALYNFVTAHRLGEVFSEMTFTLSDESGWVNGARQPDVMFVSSEKYDAFRAAAGQNLKQPFVCIPDLIVEVISPTDRYSEVSKKIKAYLADGVRLIWAVDMEEKTVTVYSPDYPLQMLAVSETLTGGDVLPGFRLTVSEIFQSQAG